MLDINEIDKNWTLFLDRDGVINYEKQNDYIHTWSEFKFYEGVLEAMTIFSKKFKHIVVVTNQRGIGKGVTKEEDVIYLHKKMKEEIEENGGRIDAIYFCKEVDSSSPCRKPNPGMGLQAVKDLSSIDLTKALMIGNTLSDMQFGRNMGIATIFLPTTRPEVKLDDEAIDAVFPSLIAFAKNLL